MAIAPLVATVWIACPWQGRVLLLLLPGIRTQQPAPAQFCVLGRAVAACPPVLLFALSERHSDALRGGRHFKRAAGIGIGHIGPCKPPRASSLYQAPARLPGTIVHYIHQPPDLVSAGLVGIQQLLLRRLPSTCSGAHKPRGHPCGLSTNRCVVICCS
jgi:hypothetical protein